MGKLIDAVYERGVFKPLDPIELNDGQRVSLSVEAVSPTADRAESQLREWAQVYDGLTDAEIAEVERIALDRSHFFRAPGEAG